jgi:hypothetical protein
MARPEAAFEDADAYSIAVFCKRHGISIRPSNIPRTSGRMTACLGSSRSLLRGFRTPPDDGWSPG